VPRQCAVCAHPERQTIDRAILAGEPKSAISRRWGIPPDATERHSKNGHVVRHESMMAGKGVLAPREGDNLLDKLGELIKIVEHLMARCVQNGQFMNSFACVRELTRRQFTHRLQTFAVANRVAEEALGQMFDIRSKIEHLHSASGCSSAWDPTRTRDPSL
jgi:hypothetical protein